MPDTYRQLLVWKRPATGRAIVYVCFERLGDGKFCVQNAEFFHAGEPAAQWARLPANTGALFMETDPGERGAWFDSVDDAIAAHDRDFS